MSSRTFPPMNGRGLRALSIATVAAIPIALALVFFYAPIEAEEGFLQKIFYLHVPLAIVTVRVRARRADGDQCTCARAISVGTCARM